MKVQVEHTNNGFLVVYDDGTSYVYRSLDDFLMLEKIAEKFLKRRIKIAEK